MKSLERKDFEIICLCGGRSCYNLWKSEIRACHFFLPWSCTEAKPLAVRQRGFNKITESKGRIESKEKGRKGCEVNSCPTRVLAPRNSTRKLRDREQCSWEGQGETSWNSTQGRVPITPRPQGHGKPQGFLEGV